MSAIRPNISALTPSAKPAAPKALSIMTAAAVSAPVSAPVAAPVQPPLSDMDTMDATPRITPGDRSKADKLIQKGLDHYDRGEFNLALDMYEDAIRADASFAMAYNNKGMVLIDLERNEEALSALSEAVARDNNYGEAYNDLGFVLRRLGDNLQAAAAYKRFLELEPDVEDGPRIQQWVDSVKSDHGVTELPALKLKAPAPIVPAAKAPPAELPKIPKMPAWQAAAGDVATAAPIDALGQYVSQPNLPVAPSGVRTVRSRRESGSLGVLPPLRSGAFSALKSAKLPVLKPMSATPEESRNRVTALVENSLDKFAEGDLDEALKLANQALDFDVDNHEVHTALGDAVRREKLDEGIKHLERSIQLCPSDPAAYYVLGFTLRAAERNVEAAEIYEKFLQLMPDALDGRKMREWVQHVKGIAQADDASGQEDDGFEDHEGIQTPADELYRDALQSFNKKPVEESVAECRIILEDHPDHCRHVFAARARLIAHERF